MKGKKNNKTWIEYRVTKIGDITQKIIPLFQKYPIIGVKALDFADWCLVADMVNKKEHLTKEGLDKIRKIKVRTNKGRLHTGNRYMLFNFSYTVPEI